MNKLIINVNPEVPPQILEFIQKKYNGTNLCFQVSSDLSNAEVNHLFKFITGRTIVNAENNSNKNASTTADLETTFSYEIRNNEENTRNCYGLSIFYQFNDWVVVRNDIYDESLKLNIGYFEGKIVDFFNDGEQDIFFIKFGKSAISKISEKKIISLIQKGISPFDTYISSSQILPCKEPDFDIDTSKIHMDIFLNFAHKRFIEYWNNTENKLLQNSQQPIVLNWENHFHNKFISQVKITAINFHNQNIKIKNTAGSDDKNGVWITIDLNEQEKIIPLVDVKRITSPDHLEFDLKFYHYWASFFCQ